MFDSSKIEMSHFAARSMLGISTFKEFRHGQNRDNYDELREIGRFKTIQAVVLLS